MMQSFIRQIALILTAFLLTTTAWSQTKWDRSQELGVSLGSSYYIGDINPRQHFGGEFHPGFGLVYRNSFTKRWSVKASVQRIRFEAHDSDSDDPWQRNRNLHFRNTLIEGSLQAELNFFPYQIGNPSFPFTPYFFGGLSIFKMTPAAEYNGTWYELQPLGTEGQGTSEGEEKYAINGIAVPFGVGIKANIIGSLAVSLEWGMRKTWTDYLDDVSTTYANPAVIEEENGELAAILADRSIEQEGIGDSNTGIQRGDASRNDWYNVFHLMITFRIGKKPNTCWK